MCSSLLTFEIFVKDLEDKKKKYACEEEEEDFIHGCCAAVCRHRQCGNGAYGSNREETF